MTPRSRSQQRDDHRLRDLVQRTGDLRIATERGGPRSTARGWLGAARTVVVRVHVVDRTEPERRQEVLKLRRRVHKLAALLRLALALRQTSGCRRTGARLPEARDTRRILRAVDRARECIPWRGGLRFLQVSPSRLQAWRRRQLTGALADQSSCPRTSPHRLRRAEVQAIEDMVTSPDYRHVPTGTLAVLAQRLGPVWASPSTWLFLHSLDSVATVHRLVAFFVDEHNRVLPHSASRGQTPDEMYVGTGDARPADLTSRAAAARLARLRPTDQRPA